ncbi:MAG: hypothetical protein HC786_03360, partial [Richelia sp. CSU_2_1]|nr:hypothetical protein [Richelia sp. CSU_2_1]
MANNIEIDRFSINGNRTVANNITVDGVNASDNFLKTPANVTLPVIPVFSTVLEQNDTNKDGKI